MLLNSLDEFGRIYMDGLGSRILKILILNFISSTLIRGEVIDQHKVNFINFTKF